jgi:hypothetical protein
VHLKASRLRKTIDNHEERGTAEVCKEGEHADYSTNHAVTCSRYHGGTLSFYYVTANGIVQQHEPHG